MARNDQVTAKFRLDGSQAKSDVQSLQSSFKSSFTEINSAAQLAKVGFEAFEAALSKVSGAVEHWIDLASTQEKLEQRLSTAIQLRESFNKQQLDTVLKLNSELERKTGIDKTQFAQLEGSLAELGVAPKHFEAAGKAAAAFADITGNDVQSSLKVVAKIFAGDVPTALKRFGVAANDAQGALDFLLSRFPVAEEHSKTFSGSIDQLKFAWRDFQEDLGKAIITNKDVQDLLADLTAKARELTGTVDDGRPKIDQFISAFVKGIRDIGTTLQDHASDFKLLLEVLVAIKGLQAATSIAGSLGALGKGLAGLGGSIAAGASGAATAVGAGATAIGGGSALLGALATGGAVVATGGLLLALPSTDSKTLADRIRESIPPRPGSGFTPDQTPYGPSLPPGFVAPQEVDFEVGTGVSVSKGDIDKRRAAAKKQAEMLAALAAGADPEEYLSKGGKSVLTSGEKDTKEQQADFETEFKLQQKHNEEMLDLQDEARLARLIAETDEHTAVQAEQEKDHKKRLGAEKKFQSAIAETLASSLANGIAGAITAGIEGKKAFGDVMLDLLGGVMKDMGALLIGMGTAGVLAGTLGVVIPAFKALTGGELGVAAGLACIAGGSLMLAGGSYLASLSGGTSAPSIGGAAVGSNINSPSAIGAPNFGYGSSAAPITNTYIVQYQGTVVNGNERQAARDLANLMRQNNALRFA